MDFEHLDPDIRHAIEVIGGYLNYSSGRPDSRFLASLNGLFASVEQGRGTSGEAGSLPPLWQSVGRVLRVGLDRVRGTSDAFRQTAQADAVVALVFDHLLPAYREHHRDLLFHQTDAFLFQPFFVGRACEAVLSEGPPWHESDRIVAGALKRLNDFIGHRPVAVLQTEQKLQPYAHEWVRPIPLYVAGAGVAIGPYHDLIETTLDVLRSTDPALLEQAWFDPELMEELAVDPRAYDFDHPVNRRPNYHFGGWDPHRIDNRGYYRRFVIQQVTLDALRERLLGGGPRDELLFEEAAVLAGTMLMGSGISGSGPDSHDSSVTLASLLPIVAAYRDALYEDLLARLSGPHARRLKAEAAELHQPFGGARQHLNQSLARRRAEQLQRVHLARLFARMGFAEAALRQAQTVAVPSARMRCEIECRLSAAHGHVEHGRLDRAAELLPQVDDFLHRAIECGALVDPWNILGFGGQFSLFHAVENSIHDHRVDELIELMGEIFEVHTRIETAAAATGRSDLRQRVSDDLAALARWWDQFASTEVGGIEGISGHQAWESAAQVSSAIAAWHQGGTAAGDVAFWREHVEQFHSPEAFALLAEALLDRRDPVASMALLMLWLSRAETIALAEGAHSFHRLALRWMDDLWQRPDPGSPGDAAAADDDPRWALACKFFDYLEANADEYWLVPRLDLAGSAPSGHDHGEGEADPDAENLFSAAYENVTYRDTTDDGFEGEMLEGGSRASDFELTREADRINKRLAFLGTVARLWKLAAAAAADAGVSGTRRDAALAAWLAQARVNRRELSDLALAVHRHRIAPTSAALDAMIEYERRRGIKETLLERIVATCVETADAGRFLLASMDDGPRPADDLDVWERPVQTVFRAVFRGDRETVRAAWPELLEALAPQPLLYVPVARGGHPQRIIVSRSIHRVLHRLLSYAPRLGLITQTLELLAAIQDMERNHPVGAGAVTEFDRLFAIGCEGIVECLVASSDGWADPSRGGPEEPLIDCVERAIEHLLKCWVSHSRNIRISVLELVAEKRQWQKLKSFVETYGHDLFTQPFMNLGNLKAILHQGPGAYLDSLEEQPDDGGPLRLVEDLDRRIPRSEASRWLELILEAVVENYPEYIDYNSTTTQSDRGEMLYTLLDFLRLGASYDRIAWNLKPVLLAHDVMVRLGRSEAARVWQRAVVERSEAVAQEHLARFERMTRDYGMRLPSIAEKLGERFVRPLEVDRLRALVRPAMEELLAGRPTESFRRLEDEIASFMQQPSGVGFDVPSWLEALEREAERIRSGQGLADEAIDPGPPIPQVPLSLEETRRQLEAWEIQSGS